MCSRKIHYVLWTVVLGSLVAAFATPARHSMTSPRQTRKTTDPPVAARGKMGQDLFLAIDHRDIAGVKALIKQGADPNSRNGLEFTPLDVAAASHQADVMESLLTAGAKADAPSAYGTALMFAAATGNAEGAALLLSRGAEVDVTRGDLNTPLLMASNAGNPAVVAELIGHKADVNAQNVCDSTALSFAARQGHVAVGKMLLDAGAQVDTPDYDGLTPLMWAAQTGHTEFVKLLLAHGAKVDARDAGKRTALICAASYGDHADVVKALLAAGADANAADAKGRTAATLAAARDYRGSAAALGATAAPVTTRTTSQAIGLSLKALERSMTEFSRNSSCISCHQEGLGRMTTGEALARGWKVDEALRKTQEARINGALGAMEPLHDMALKDPQAMKQVPLIEINEVNTVDGWVLAGMAANRDPGNRGTEAMTMVFARQQLKNGSWTFSLPRVPMQSSNFTFTALAIRALSTYGPKARAAEIAERKGRARDWLVKTPAQTGDDKSFRLLGLKWAGASRAQVAGAASDLAGGQQPDGGWGQVPGMASDAYATGQALYALRVGAGMSASDPIYTRGLRYLLRTQDEDGTWFVNKRAIPANNYFDAGFPHGESQYASFNGTCWATLAMLQAGSRK